MRAFKKKSQASVFAALFMILLVAGIAWLIHIRQRECNTNKDCPTDNYCGSDFACHEYPTIQRTYVEYSLMGPALVIALAILITAILLNFSSIFPRKERHEEQTMKEKHEHRHEDSSDADNYYGSADKVKDEPLEDDSIYYKRQTKQDAKGQQKNHSYYDESGH